MQEPLGSLCAPAYMKYLASLGKLAFRCFYIVILFLVILLSQLVS